MQGVPDLKRGTGLRLGIWTLAILACLGVFALYTQPGFLVTLANQVWACF